MMARQTVSWFKSGNTTHEMHPGSNDHVAECLPSFAFIYGTLPTAPTVVVFATMYNVQVETVSSPNAGLFVVTLQNSKAKCPTHPYSLTFDFCLLASDF